MAVAVARRLFGKRRGASRSTAPAPAPPLETPAGYRTFSPKLAPTLGGLGGLVAALGALGVWIRATRVPFEGSLPEQVAVISGTAEPVGWALAALGLAAALASVTWTRAELLAKAPAGMAAVGVAGIAGWWLATLDDRARAMAVEAQANPDFVVFHAGFGWGAWLLLLGSVLLMLGLVAGTLRELDVRRAAR